MQNPTIRKFGLLVVIFTLAACCTGTPASAQFQNPIQAAKDAWNKAKQQQQPQPAAQPAGTPANAPANDPANTTTQPAPAQPGNTPATSAPPANAQGAAAVWTPPSGASTTGSVPVPAGPLDPSKLPDVGGIHIGATSAEVAPILQKLHPGAPLQPQPNGQGMPPTGVLLSVGTANPQSADNILVDYTFEPNKPQTAYFVWRSVMYATPIAKQALVDALRQKYGKEIQSTSPNSSIGIVAMYWLFDEQGHAVAANKTDGPNSPPYGCQGDYAQNDGVNLYRNVFRNDENNALAPATYCDSLIVLHVALDGIATVTTTRTVLMDNGLLRRSAVAIGEGQKAADAKKRQLDLQKANQAKPSL